jgi:hypothetical protein
VLTGSHIVVAGRLGATAILQTIAARLRAIGHDVDFHEDAAAFHAPGR